MSSPSRILIALALLAASVAALAASGPAARADDALVYNPYQPGYHPGPPAWYYRYRSELAPDWFERRDSVTLQHGNAVHANQAIQMVDPWPPYIANRNIPYSGIKMDQAIDRYHGVAQ